MASTLTHASECRWASTKSYDELREILLFQHDLPGENYTVQGINEKALTKAQVIEDLDCLELVFKTAYSASAYYKSQGIDLVQRIEELKANVDLKSEPFSRQWLLNQFFNLHMDAFDGHAFYFFVNERAALNGPQAQVGTAKGPKYPVFVYIREPFQKVANRIVYNQQGILRVIERCDNLQPVEVALNRDQQGFGNTTFAGFRQDDSIESVDCWTERSHKITFSLTRYQAAPDSTPNQEATSKGALIDEIEGIQYLRIGKFPNPMTTNQQRIIDLLLTTDKPVLIDGRGIGGGAEPFKEALEKTFFSEAQQLPTSKNFKTWSFLSLLGVAQVYETMKFKATWDPNLTEEERQRRIISLDSTIDNWGTAAEYYSQLYSLDSINDVATDVFQNKTEGTRRKEKIQPVIILFDRGCGSQCEFLVSTFRHHPKVTLVGVPTAGRLNFANNGSIFLPNSKISFIPSSARTTHSPDVKEGEGIWPSQFVFTENAKDIAIKMLKDMNLEIQKSVINLK